MRFAPGTARLPGRSSGAASGRRGAIYTLGGAFVGVTERPPVDGPSESGGVSPPDDEPREGIVSVRTALVGIGFIWLTAVSTFGAAGAAVYGVRTSSGYLLVAALAAALAVAAGSGALRTFGYR